jgi:tRNA nucleotidyltransferase (CCA-adding enzyme)
MNQTITPEVGWELFPHDADTGVLGRGRTVAEAFEQAALALTAVVTSAPVEAVARVAVACERKNIELLLVDWLDSVIYEMAVRKMLFGRYSVKIKDGRLTGTLWGEPVDVVRHAPACEPKGTTLTALAVTQEPSGLWSARCVIDV